MQRSFATIEVSLRRLEVDLTPGSPLPTGLRVRRASRMLPFVRLRRQRDVWSGGLELRTWPDVADFGLVDWGRRQPRFDVGTGARDEGSDLLFALTKGGAVLSQERVPLREILQMVREERRFLDVVFPTTEFVEIA